MAEKTITTEFRIEADEIKEVLQKHFDLPEAALEGELTGDHSLLRLTYTTEGVVKA